MKILLTALFCLCLCLPAFADQQTTVLTEQTTVGKASASLPFIDGSNDTVREKQANALTVHSSGPAALSGAIPRSSISASTPMPTRSSAAATAAPDHVPPFISCLQDITIPPA